MKRIIFNLLFLLLLTSSCDTDHKASRILPAVPKGAEALTVTGEALYTTQPTPSVMEKYKRAYEDWKDDRMSADKLIWYGRWTAYCGNYRDAIKIFTKGVEEHPSDARMLRHRGHRYISIREFSRAIDDLEQAALLVAFSDDEVEPDGMPNPLNIPVSTLKSNIFYHLGLAYYLDGDLDEALKAWTRDLSLSVNDDMNVATLHWVYMTLREMQREDEALDALSDITSEMTIIENGAYHKVCLFYKGDLSVEELTGEGFSEIMNDAMLYGLGNWYLYNQDTLKAREYFSRIFETGAWASFGYIAAEVKMSGL